MDGKYNLAILDAAWTRQYLLDAQIWRRVVNELSFDTFYLVNPVSLTDALSTCLPSVKDQSVLTKVLGPFAYLLGLEALELENVNLPQEDVTLSLLSERVMLWPDVKPAIHTMLYLANEGLISSAPGDSELNWAMAAYDHFSSADHFYETFMLVGDINKLTEVNPQIRYHVYSGELI